MSTRSPLIRLTPLQLSDLPPHPDIKPKDASSSNVQPDLLTFALTTLDQGHALLLPKDFNLIFKSHSWKTSPPSNNEIEVLSAEVPSSDISTLSFSTPSLPRSKPTKIHDEYWYARRSYHHNLSVKNNASGTASFSEFIYGLRDRKSEREAQFTSDLYDAHFICSWTDELAPLIATANQTRDGSVSSPRYSHVTMSIYEMCHKLPGPVAPRCFPVLVLTASVSESEFIAVTLPVNITSSPLAFYSSGRNKSEGTDHQSKKSVTIGNYVAVERVHKYAFTPEHAKDMPKGRDHGKAMGEGSEEIEWVMATASHAKGNIPMAMQRMGVPGAIAKDVGLFLKWIKNVPGSELASVKVGINEGVMSGNGVVTDSAT